MKHRQLTRTKERGVASMDGACCFDGRRGTEKGEGEAEDHYSEESTASSVVTDVRYPTASPEYIPKRLECLNILE
ncbi:hypothetical protein BVRB_9g210870 [Beta vulgaris subsp. vulgaris]|nr:hypothetical protein BVRB_9g210870 [Beta vulgaris subsp. vulgaris]